MAIDPKLKAKVIAAWTTGNYSEEELATKFKVGKGTVGRWTRALKGAEAVQTGPVNPKAARFEDSVLDFMQAGLRMVQRQAEMLGDPDHLSKKSTDEIIKHTGFIFERLERVVVLARSLGSSEPGPALPAPATGGDEVAIPELVEPEQTG